MGSRVDTVEMVEERRMLPKLTVVMSNHASLLPPTISIGRKERFRRSFLLQPSDCIVPHITSPPEKAH